jgi:hypothetical protein
MRRRCERLRWRRVDNALLIHRYGLPANTTLKDEPPCPATAAPKCGRHVFLRRQSAQPVQRGGLEVTRGKGFAVFHPTQRRGVGGVGG